MNSRPPRGAIVVSVVVCMCLLGGGVGTAAGAIDWNAEDDKRIRFRTDLIASFNIARANDLVTFAYFSAPWCGWCRKMETTTFTDRSVIALRNKFMWVKIDVDKEQEIAAIFAVQGVPHIVLLDSAGRVIGTTQGYMSSSRMSKFLRDSMKKAAGAPAAATSELIEKLKLGVIPSGSTAVPPALKAAIERLAQPQRAQRDTLLASIRALGPSVWAPLCELLGEQRLAVRAAAADALSDATGHTLPFDPFAKVTVRGKQIAAWKKWVQDNAPSATTRSAAEPYPRTQPATTQAAQTRPSPEVKK